MVLAGRHVRRGVGKKRDARRTAGKKGDASAPPSRAEVGCLSTMLRCSKIYLDSFLPRISDEREPLMRTHTSRYINGINYTPNIYWKRKRR